MAVASPERASEGGQACKNQNNIRQTNNYTREHVPRVTAYLPLHVHCIQEYWRHSLLGPYLTQQVGVVHVPIFGVRSYLPYILAVSWLIYKMLVPVSHAYLGVLVRGLESSDPTGVRESCGFL